VSVIGKIERVPLREVWPHQAYDLTTWLEENVDVVNDVLGLSLVSAASGSCEKRAMPGAASTSPHRDAVSRKRATSSAA
jgi:hypothetical protein